MRKLFLKILLFVSPILLLLIVFTAIDVFKFFGDYDNYYDKSFVSLNREHVCFNTYRNNIDKKHYNSFIFGSSRSQSFKTNEWKKFLEQSAVPFHFDASGEGLRGISDKIKYIDNTENKISNALVIIDRTILNQVTSRSGHLFIPNPEISGDSKIDYYTTILKAKMNPKFAAAYIDYSLFKSYRNYMGKFIIKDKYKNTHDSISCDIWYGKDQEIKDDSIGYYKNLDKKNVFFVRPTLNRLDLRVTDLEIEQLIEIRKIFLKHKTKYKIVVAPLYNQICLEADQLVKLQEIFGPENIFNYSGVNKYTESKGNYYEASHFKTSVSNDIMKEIYSDNLSL